MINREERRRMRLADRVGRHGHEYGKIAHILLFCKVDSRTNGGWILMGYRFAFVNDKNK